MGGGVWGEGEGQELIEVRVPNRFIIRVWWMRWRAETTDKPRSFPTYKMTKFKVSVIGSSCH